MPVNSVIRFSDASLIAVHALAALASDPERRIQGRDLAEAMGASGNHLAKVMQRLVRARLVLSVKGPLGGFSLARDPSEVSILDAISAVDGPMAVDFCPFRPDRCDPSQCVFGKEVSKHAGDLVEYLGRRTIADILREGRPRFQPPVREPRTRAVRLARG
ncbi:MAG TPA: Rrf2 family transcriptional regulator [Magnetospirillaceae bacterium]|nr:Rrf2 family transcriptional regulator [Magnetospirillaceae bacterium]